MDKRKLDLRLGPKLMKIKPSKQDLIQMIKTDLEEE